MVEANNQRADAKWTHTTRLCVPLLHAGDVLCDVLDGDGVLDGETVRLRLEAGLVDEDAGVGVESREGEGDVVVQQLDLGRRDPRVLELHGRALLAAEHDHILALDADGAGS